ncbi:fused MFS/spermidine synthase [Oceaniglobus ichthyenteri]|uniref:fused MFS/spermidine synthase n=1 Tax=Oceaniglobus ichthyenteri TaxID=2136177 RepID=UPI000D343C0E|nr:fused MFS/spermidine synthase [Oceaniglobus ichthyenteri]
MHTTDTPARTHRISLTPVLFTTTIFLSASLLFFVQPLFAKIVLPQIGGAPAVWTTAMLFFQSVLIGGYLYAHLLTRYVPVRAQMACHITIWALALLFLPLSVPDGWSYDASGSATWQTLLLFAAGVGVPFAVLSANAPLIQRWYGTSGGPSADDPYFLYGASNLGSLIALLAFPLVAEPWLGADRIGTGWMYGFMALGGFLMLSGLCARGSVTCAPKRAALPLTLRQIGIWLVLAFVPSSLMLAATTKIATDIGSIPMVWVVPLALYLLSFVFTFTQRPVFGAGVLRIGYLAALAVLGLIFTKVFGAHLSWFGVGALIASFFAVALFCHGRLYDTRPEAAHLTVFYLIMSVGGALGGLFNSIIAPALFDGLYEGGVTTLIAALLVLSGRMKLSPQVAGMGVLVGLGAVLPIIVAVESFGVKDATMLSLGLVALIGCVALLLRKTLLAAAIAAATLTLVGATFIPDTTHFRDRSFFGTHQVSDEGALRLYSNGTTVHGAQRLADFDGQRPEPLYYYHKNGPMAQVMTSDIGQAATSVGIVGLGVGSLACYALPHQEWQFYEIDRVVDRVARNPDYFTFMSHCAANAPTHLGDARVVLAQQKDARYDILVIDAYSSDSVPVHLTTHEAMELYLSRLNPGGVLVYHISNRYYAIHRPLARSAAALGLAARIQHYPGKSAQDPADSPSRVVMFARHDADLGQMAGDGRWAPLTSDGERVWTDNYANLLSILE